MMFIQIIVVLIAIIAISTFFKYNPKFDLIISGNKYMLLLWYNKYSCSGDRVRTYFRICEFKTRK